jgi:coenzyme F420-reducing hydrogenase beta subunit
MADNSTEKRQNYKMQDEAKIEQQFLNGAKDQNIGVYSDLFSARSSIEGQDGGVVSALLAKGFQEGLFDSAVVVRRGEGYSAEAVVASNASEVLAAKGTKYLRVNVTKKLRELISQGEKRIAIVCTPCEAKATRKIQQTLKNDCEITIIGLFCFEAFNNAKLKKEVKKRLGIDLDKAQKTQVKQGKFMVSVDGKEHSCRVKDLDEASEEVCRFCDDFISRFADVSVGSVGSKQGYSTVLARSKIGEKMLKNIDLPKEPVDKLEIDRLSKFKKERAEKSFSNLNKSD